MIYYVNLNVLCRCPTYQLQPGCKLVTDPNDVCCQVPQCFATPNPNPQPQPTGPPPTPFPNGTYPSKLPTTPPPVTPTPFPYPVSYKPGVIVGTPPPAQRTGEEHNLCKIVGANLGIDLIMGIFWGYKPNMVIV